MYEKSVNILFAWCSAKNGRQKCDFFPENIKKNCFYYLKKTFFVQNCVFCVKIHVGVDLARRQKVPFSKKKRKNSRINTKSRIWREESCDQIIIKFCREISINDVIVVMSFGDDQLSGYGIVRGQIAIHLRHRPHNTLIKALIFVHELRNYRCHMVCARFNISTSFKASSFLANFSKQASAIKKSQHIP